MYYIFLLPLRTAAKLSTISRNTIHFGPFVIFLEIHKTTCPGFLVHGNKMNVNMEKQVHSSPKETLV